MVESNNGCDHIDLLSHKDLEKNDHIHFRINNDLKALFEKEARRANKTLTNYIIESLLDVITGQTNCDHREIVITRKDNDSDLFRKVSFQLINLFDKIFSLDLEKRNVAKIIDLLNRIIDEKMIEEARKKLELE
jgi:uncharacterized protein (DUF1778 family)